MNYSWKSALLFWGVTTIVIVIGWYWVGRQAAEAVTVSINNREHQVEIDKELGRMKATQEAEQRKLLQIADDIRERGTTISQDLEDELGRLAADINQNQTNIENLSRMKAIRTAEDSQRRASFKEMQLRKQALGDLVRNVRERVDERNRLVSSLRKDESGRRIAASVRHLDRFEAITLVLSPSVKDVEIWNTTYRNLLEFVDATDRPPESFVVTDSIDADISELEQNLKSGSQALQEDLMLLNKLVKETADETPVKESLAHCIASRIARRAEERADAIAAAAEKARQDGTTALSKAAVDAQNARDRLEAAIKAAEAADLDAAAHQKI